MSVKIPRDGYAGRYILLNLSTTEHIVISHVNIYHLIIIQCMYYGMLDLPSYEAFGTKVSLYVSSTTIE